MKRLIVFLLALVVWGLSFTPVEAEGRADARARAAFALALACQRLKESTPAKPEPAKKTCDCSEQCTCGCNEGKPCSCQRVPGETVSPLPSAQRMMRFFPATRSAGAPGCSS